MNNFKVGDKVKVKKLSKKEWFNSQKYFPLYFSYNQYLEKQSSWFNKVFIIGEISLEDEFSLIGTTQYIFFYKFELEKINFLKNKISKIKKLLNK